MFTLIKKNGDRIPLEDWLVRLWAEGVLNDPWTLELFQSAKSIKGDWKSLREAQLKAANPDLN